MDANGTRFHLLLGKADWARCLDEDGHVLGDAWKADPDARAEVALSWDDDRDELTLLPRLFQFVAAAKDVPPAIDDRRGAGRDRFGTWYWISENGTEILVASAGTQVTSHFWSPCDGVECRRREAAGGFAPASARAAPPTWPLSGLAVTEDHYLVVGVLRPAGLLIFDLHAGGPPRQMLWPEGIGFSPLDMAPMPGGGVWILDRDRRQLQPGTRYWGLDRFFSVVRRDQQERTIAAESRDDFQSAGGGAVRRSAAQTFSTGINLDAALPLGALDAIAIEALPDGTVLILERRDPAPSMIHRYRFGAELGAPVSTAAVHAVLEPGSTFVLLAHDFAFVPEHGGPDGLVADRLYVAGADGNQAFAFRITQRDDQLELDAVAEHLPMRLFGGKGLVAAGSQAYYDFSDGWIPLVEQRRPRFDAQAALHTPVLDGGEPDCVWHRLMLDACIPPETHVAVWTRAANERRDVEIAEWQAEPDPYLRGAGSEQAFANGADYRGGGNRWAPSAAGAARTDALDERAARRAHGNGTWELLIQRARGRYAQVKLELAGNERTTPRLRALRAYYPRFSYAQRYLPGVYREDAQSASFVERFLANLEGVYTGVEDEIAAVQLLFDPASAPAEALPWLAGWFGVVLDPTWDDRKRRLFVARAMEFFQCRGTIRGLEIALRLALEPCADETIFAATEAYVPRRIAARRYEDCAPAPRSVDRRSKRVQPGGIRIVETFRTRRTPGVVLGDPTELDGLPEITAAARWSPALGAPDLHDRYKAFLGRRYRPVTPLPSVVTFPIRSPESQLLAETSAAAVTPSVEPGDAELWQTFLVRRYADVGALNASWATTYADFGAVPLPRDLQARSVALLDWNAFVTEKAAVWEDFARRTLGFVPSASTDDRRQWQQYLARAYGDVGALDTAYDADYAAFTEVPLPAGVPADPVRRCDWEAFRSFSAASVAASARRLWQDFLARRYRRVGALNDAHETTWSGFDSVSLPDALPRPVAALRDWYQLESVVLAMHRSAHRFSVLLPLPTDQRGDPAEYRRRYEIAERIVQWEKPAHTVFDVKFYWALFRVGGAQVGEDTVLDRGSRAPELMSALVLGHSFLAESRLTAAPPQDAADRRIAGRDRLSRRRNDALAMENTG